MDINQVPQIQTQIQPVKNKSHNALKTTDEDGNKKQKYCGVMVINKN